MLKYFFCMLYILPLQHILEQDTQIFRPRMLRTARQSNPNRNKTKKNKSGNFVRMTGFIGKGGNGHHATGIEINGICCMLTKGMMYSCFNCMWILISRSTCKKSSGRTYIIEYSADDAEIVRKI